jgi:hypothetical protein
MQWNDFNCVHQCKKHGKVHTENIKKLINTYTKAVLDSPGGIAADTLITDGWRICPRTWPWSQKINPTAL